MSRHKKKPGGALKGRRLGGLARAEALTPERRSQIAEQAARARWDDPTPRRRPAKTEVIRLRIAPGEKGALIAAAAREGQELSAWLRQVALDAAGVKRQH